MKIDHFVKFLTIGVLSLSSIFGKVYLVSDRDEFKNAEELADKENNLEWVSEMAGKKVAVLIHGYNNDYEEAKGFFQKLSEGIKDNYDEVICYLWPGFDDFWEYKKAKKLIVSSELSSRLHVMLEKLSSEVEKLDVVGFSKGCRLALEALGKSDTKIVENLFLLAPAVDNESLEQGERYHKSLDYCEKAYVFYSKNDDVLRFGYPIFELDRALGYTGPEDRSELHPAVKLVNATKYVSGHSKYAGSAAVHAYIAKVLKKEEA